MSYKFPVYRCDTCAVIRFDPPNADQSLEVPYPCRIVYATGERVSLRDGRVVDARTTCGGTVRPWALMDFDTFITRLEGGE